MYYRGMVYVYEKNKNNEANSFTTQNSERGERYRLWSSQTSLTHNHNLETNMITKKKP